jgi:hypothetical protein
VRASRRRLRTSRRGWMASRAVPTPLRAIYAPREFPHVAVARFSRNNAPVHRSTAKFELPGSTDTFASWRCTVIAPR